MECRYQVLNIVQKETHRKTNIEPKEGSLGDDPFLLGVGGFSEEQRLL